MYGYQVVVIWLVLFFSFFYPFVRKFNAFHRMVAYWCFIMLFIAVFEGMLIFHYDYMCRKGKYYKKKKKCFWNEDGKCLGDMLSSKMYMELYSDYSLADCKYRKNVGHDGFHFVLFGELWHGFFSGILSILILYFLYMAPESRHYLLSFFTLGVVQLTMIIWYVSPVILELFIEKSGNHWSKWWWPPFLWNMPWFIIPPMLIYYGAWGLLN